jgi:class 3 adenylate cyclase/CHASE2 domain-containing sensor protein
MARSDRRLRRFTFLAGSLATATVAVAYLLGWLDPVEGGLYDARARLCQVFTPKPTDKLVHVDIDDAALEAMGAWPWPRTLTAGLVDEMAAAGAKAVALDVLYTEPQDKLWEPAEKRWDGGTPAAGEARTGTFTVVDHDANLAAAFARAGNVLLPASLLFVPAHPQNPTMTAAVELLTANLELTREQLVSDLLAKRLAATEVVGVEAVYFDLRREAARARIERELDKVVPATGPAATDVGPTTRGATRPAVADAAVRLALRRALFPGRDPALESPETRVVDEAYDHVRAARTLARFGRPPAAGASAYASRNQIMPVPALLAAAAASGFVDYPNVGDGVVRSVPLMMSHGGRWYLQLGLRVACQMLDVDPAALVVTPTDVTIPAGTLRDGTPRAAVTIPVRTVARQTTSGRTSEYPLVMDIPWFGGRLWYTMYDPARPNLKAQHLPLSVVYGAVRTRRKIEDTTAGADRAARYLLGFVDAALKDGKSRLKAYERDPLTAGPGGEPREAQGADRDGHSKSPDRQGGVASTGPVLADGPTRTPDDATSSTAGPSGRPLESASSTQPLPDGRGSLNASPSPPDAEASKLAAVLTEIEALIPPETTEADAGGEEKVRAAIVSAAAVRAAKAELPKLRAQWTQQRKELRQVLGGKAAIVGWTAVASVADQKPTPLHAGAPGVVVHGVIASAILTGDLWRTLPPWVTVAAVLVLGLATTAAASRLPAVASAPAAVVLASAYALANGYLLFDYGNQILDLGAPLLAVAVSWASGTVTRLYLEGEERRRITSRLGSYVDPGLVKYVLETRDETVLSGQRRETTVAFTDLEGFTTLSESMGEAVVPLLNDFMGRATVVINRHNGFVNKFLGDGILFFFNAPRPTDSFVPDAINAILDLQLMMAAFNDELAAGGHPRLRLRAGATTGLVIAGNAGSQKRFDYTVIGDLVNLAARLESANKFFGTSNLVTERTVEKAGDGFLFRPVGVIQVVGRSAGERVYETLGWAKDATDQQRTVAARSKAMFDAFTQGRAADCLTAVSDLEEVAGASKLTKMYRDRCAPYVSGAATGEMPREIVLAEK